MAGPLALASALSRLVKIKCPYCKHEKLVEKKATRFRKCPRCHKQFPDPLTTKRR
jgi:transposase-like protein